MCKTFMIGAMKPVSLLFDQPTYIFDIQSCEVQEYIIDKIHV